MPNGTFQQYLDALRAFESGFDAARYATGQIVDAQLDLWAGGPVSEFYPDLASWGEMTDAQWREMSYRSENTLGFVGYQFGEALLIDLGYYEADTFYGNGAATNSWAGTWTGKNGVTSLEDFKTEAVQEAAIREAFGYNLSIIENGLANAGTSLGAVLGSTRSYEIAGETVEVTFTLTGLLSAAHLRGAYGTLNLLLSDSVSTDENGTSILQYVRQFGGYDAPPPADLIALYDGPAPGGAAPSAGGTAGVDAETADIVLTWDYGAQTRVEDFDPETGTIFVGWVGAADLEVAQDGADVVFALIGNAQTLTLANVSLADLSAANFTFLDATAAEEVLALVGEGDPGDGGGAPGGDGGAGDDGGPSEDGSGQGGDEAGDGTDTGGDAGETGGTGTAGVTAETADVVVDWAWGAEVAIGDFDPATGTIFVGWVGADALEIFQSAEGVVLAIPSNQQSTTLTGVTLADLSAANFTVLDATAEAEILAAIGGGTGGTGGDTGGGQDDGTGDDHGGDGHGGGMHEHMHVVIGPGTPAQVIDGFRPAMGDVIEIEAGITADAFALFEESGEALGQTVRIELTQGGETRQIVLTGFGLDDLGLGNFSIADEAVLNEVASTLGTVVAAPGTGGGYDPTYDADGSNPPAVTGTTEAGGTKFRTDPNADDITGFDPIRDELDFGGISVHGLVVNKSQTGEIVIDSPWSAAAQIVQGVGFEDVTLGSFGVVGNEHLRQDLGGVLSWEKGVGPREADTVYVRSHEYGVHEVVDGFDPGSMTLSFLYFGTRERLTVEDTEAGLRIESMPTGQSLTLTGVQKADLVPGRVEFHHDQVMEDNLEDAFGFSQGDVTLVSREGLLTPAAPAGAATDGFQTRTGVMEQGAAPAPADADPADPEGGTEPTPGAGTVAITWDWGVVETVEGFDPAADVFDFGALQAGQLDVTEAEGDLVIEVLGNGGHRYEVADLQAEDLTRENLAADAHSGLLDEDGAFLAALTDLGFGLG